MKFRSPVLTLALCACSPEAPADPPVAEAPPMVQTSIPVTREAPPAPPGTRAIEFRSDAAGGGYEGKYLHFNYHWIGDVSQRGPLYDHLMADMARERQRVERLSEEGNRGRKVPAKHDYEKRWQLAGKGARLISLAGSVRHYAGEPPARFGFAGLIWDRKLKKPLSLGDILRDKTAFDKALQQPFCAALNQKRAERLDPHPPPPDGRPPARRIPPLAAPCPPGGAQTIVPADLTGDGLFDALEVMVPQGRPPYPADGHAQHDVPVDERMLALIRPDYRSSFRVQAQ